MNNPLIRFPTTLLPYAPDLLLEDVQQTDQTLLLVLRSTAPTAACPLCQQSATRVHGHYARHPADLPWAGHAVRFALHVRKFFCLNPTCPRRIFTERLPDVVAPSALGGEAGARLAQQIGIAASPTLLISLIRRVSVPPHPSPRFLGVDDWAQRKGIRYGTALVDLERHRLIRVPAGWHPAGSGGGNAGAVAHSPQRHRGHRTGPQGCVCDGCAGGRA